MALKTDIRKLKADKAKLVTDVRKVLTAAGTRALTGEEKQEVERREATIDELDERIAALEKALEMEGDDDDDDDDEPDADRDDDKPDDRPREEDDERSVVVVNGVRMVKVGSGKTKPQTRAGGGAATKPARWVNESDAEYAKRCRRSTRQYADAFLRYLHDGDRGVQRALERRDVQADIDYNGGYLVAPQQFVQTLIKAVDNLLWVRQRATKFQVVGGQSLGAPALDTDVDDGDWTSELATGNVDTAMAFGKRELTPRPLAKRLKASNKLLRMASINGTTSNYDAESGTGPVENFIISRLKYKLGVPQEKAFMTGNGVNQPLGLFVASSRGISTGRDVLTGAATGVTGDGLIAAKYSLKQQYQETAEWLFHRDAVRRIRQLKDSYGQYLWMPGLQEGQPDRLLNRPIMMSEYAPSTFTTGSYVGMFGDFSHYWIADSLDFQIQKLIELYAEANQTGFICRAELDGMPVQEEAFARLKTD